MDPPLPHPTTLRRAWLCRAGQTAHPLRATSLENGLWKRQITDGKLTRSRPPWDVVQDHANGQEQIKPRPAMPWILAYEAGNVRPMHANRFPTGSGQALRPAQTRLNANTGHRQPRSCSRLALSPDHWAKNISEGSSYLRIPCFLSKLASNSAGTWFLETIRAHKILKQNELS